MARPIPEIKSMLDAHLLRINQPDFIPYDPIQIPHRYSLKEDIEIAGFLTALLAWGRRDLIIRSADRFMNLMDDAPFAFVTNASVSEMKRLQPFVHRTFNGQDAMAMVKGLRRIYAKIGGLETLLSPKSDEPTIKEAITRMRNAFVSQSSFPARTHKHLADPEAGSAAKRINMFLRWMVRKDKGGVDFGLWKGVQPQQLIVPLDLHSGAVARALGLLKRKQNDWQAAVELTENLRKLAPDDPVKYDIALFGLGAEGFLKG